MGLSSPEFCTKNETVVKITGVEKVGKVSKGVGYFYVNQENRGMLHMDCG